MEESLPQHIYAERTIREAIRHRKVDDKIRGERGFAKELGGPNLTPPNAFERLVPKFDLNKVPKKASYVPDQNKNSA